MTDWPRAIYDATGIPLEEDDIIVAFREGHPWLMLHRHPVLKLRSGPSPDTASLTGLRGALAAAMERRLAESVPRVEQLLRTLAPEAAHHIQVAVVNAEGFPSLLGPPSEERGWPHFLLRLSALGLDVEVDLDPYTPDAPYDLQEVRRQAEVLLQVVDTAARPH